MNPDVTCKRKEGHLTKKTPHSFSAFPREFLADDLTPLFHPFPLQRWLLIWVKGSREGGIDWETLARWKRKDSPWGPPWLVLYASYGSLPSIRGHLPSRHHCQTLYRRQMDACVLLRTRRKTEEECSNILGSCRILERLEDGNGNDFQTVNTEIWWKSGGGGMVCTMKW